MPQEPDKLDFIKEVARYFMDFLETDFHKRKNPRRSIRYKNEDNFLVGFNAAKYPRLAQDIRELIRSNFRKDKLDFIAKGVYRSNLPEGLLSVVELQADKISPKLIKEVTASLVEAVESNAALYPKELDKAILTANEAVAGLIRSALVLPFIKNIEKPLQNLDLGDENIIYQMEEDLTDVFMGMLYATISEVVQKIAAGTSVNTKAELSDGFDAKGVRSAIQSFFVDFQVADAYRDLYELDRNRNILDKQDCYLYFGDITFNRVKYPLFYIPVSLKSKEDGLAIEFDAQFYINKKALEFIAQEYNKLNGHTGSLATITERIIYISQLGDEKLVDKLNLISTELANFFELDKAVDFSDDKSQLGRSLLVRLNDGIHFCLFDKSDEALVNDYEEILRLLATDDEILGGAFQELVSDFILKDPKQYIEEVETEWDDSSVQDKLVYPSPIPLNSEQRQILRALGKKDCKYLTVSGPPGTGKSHTITAITFDAIQKGQNVLVLSDKAEALDVVEDKITQTLNRVRGAEDFQNPILRLGKTGSTYARILSGESISRIRAHHRVQRTKGEQVQEALNQRINSLQEDLVAEGTGYEDIKLSEVHEYYDLEGYFGDAPPVEFSEFSGSEDVAVLQELRDAVIETESYTTPQANGVYKLLYGKDEQISLDELRAAHDKLNALQRITTEIDSRLSSSKTLFQSFSTFGGQELEKLSRLNKKLEEMGSGLFGYLFKGGELERLRAQYTDEFPGLTISDLRQEKSLLVSFESLCKSILSKAKSTEVLKDLDPLELSRILMVDEVSREYAKGLVDLSGQLDYLSKESGKFKNTLIKLGAQVEGKEFGLKKESLLRREDDFDRLLRLLDLRFRIGEAFGAISETDYGGQQKIIEKLATVRMADILDGRLIDFYDEHLATAKAIRSIITSKRQFPRDEFDKLRYAFPCILAGIRDYAEYIPLAPDIFDLLIIDEASQVSIAQAFPALLRAKKVLILGDKKQFSNIKAAQARSDTNREYTGRLKDVFTSVFGSGTAQLVRMEKFNIKTSILDFFEYISNYSCQLKKHFRGYKEIISYSNKHFYKSSLEVMKIRAKRIEDVLKFDFIEQGDEIPLIPNTNEAEIANIAAQLQGLKEVNYEGTVGIITPHTNQQKLIDQRLRELPEVEHYYEKFRLKVMTFDTCQGEERDTIFYSMVAGKEMDKLWGVFISDLSKIDIEEDGQIKAQRLNVGFSRARECMHFILSKPIADFNGSIHDALNHYEQARLEAQKEPLPNEVDPHSPMEREVLNWVTQTAFWKSAQQREAVYLKPQFEIGKYLRQLDPNYSHPAYKVDFLLVYEDESHREHKIIIEYDGFKEHFGGANHVTEYNYKEYYSEADLYRQKVLESYDYRFLRINRFNIGENPIATLSGRLEHLVLPEPDDDFLQDIRETVQKVEDGEMKECPKCLELRSVNDFKDPMLTRGYGRICRHCKRGGVSGVVRRISPQELENDITCPRCSSPMIKRHGRYGDFYGCSRFPRCKGTRKM